MQRYATPLTRRCRPPPSRSITRRHTPFCPRRSPPELTSPLSNRKAPREHHAPGGPASEVEEIVDKRQLPCHRLLSVERYAEIVEVSAVAHRVYRIYIPPPHRLVALRIVARLIVPLSEHLDTFCTLQSRFELFFCCHTQIFLYLCAIISPLYHGASVGIRIKVSADALSLSFSPVHPHRPQGPRP